MISRPYILIFISLNESKQHLLMSSRDISPSWHETVGSIQYLLGRALFVPPGQLTKFHIISPQLRFQAFCATY